MPEVVHVKYSVTITYKLTEFSDSGSEDSSSKINKKRDGSPDIRIEYKGKNFSYILKVNQQSI